MTKSAKEDLTKEKSSEETEKNYCIDFHGATFINNAGQEVEITEDMVEDACEQFLNNTSK